MIEQFNFEKGDVIGFCDESYYVIENNGNSGVVCPFGETYYLRNFYWKFEGESCVFVRKSSPQEFEKLFPIN